MTPSSCLSAYREVGVEGSAFDLGYWLKRPTGESHEKFWWNINFC